MTCVTGPLQYPLHHPLQLLQDHPSHVTHATAPCYEDRSKSQGMKRRACSADGGLRGVRRKPLDHSRDAAGL
jgi:hypothetical protein